MSRSGADLALLLLALVGFLLGMLQWLLAFFRTAGLLVLAALLTLAAARAEWTKRIVPRSVNSNSPHTSVSNFLWDQKNSICELRGL